MKAGLPPSARSAPEWDVVFALAESYPILKSSGNFSSCNGASAASKSKSRIAGVLQRRGQHQ
jgi:hypothetical protein